MRKTVLYTFVTVLLSISVFAQSSTQAILERQRDTIIQLMQSTSITQSEYDKLHDTLEKVYATGKSAGISALGFVQIPPPFHGISPAGAANDAELNDLKKQIIELSAQARGLRDQLAQLTNRNPKKSPMAYSIHQELDPLESKLRALNAQYRARVAELERQ